MAYAAVISLKQTIQRFVNSHILIVPTVFVSLQESESRSFLTRRSGKEFLSEITDLASMELQSLQQILKDINSSSSSEKLNALDGQIKDALYRFEDILESHLSHQFILQSDHHQSLADYDSSVDLKELKQDIDSFTETVKMVKEEFILELNNPLPHDHTFSSTSIVCGDQKKTRMVGASDTLRNIKNLVSDWWSSKVQTISLVGMAGVGKTTLAKQVFEDIALTWKVFQQYRGFERRASCCAFVTIGPEFRLREVMLSILAQVNGGDNVMRAQGGDDDEDDELAEYLKESLLRRRYFIVLDDVWNKQAWDDLKRLFPEMCNGSRIMLTTRIEEVAQASSNEEFAVVKISFLNKEESWDLLHEKVFDEKPCPSQLEKAGRKIAENCDGLPLLIVTVAKILRKAEKSPEYWNEVAKKENLVFIEAYDQISNILHPSYVYLPQRLKACFLYMGVFPQKYEIPRSKLINLWIAEGFLEQNRRGIIEHLAEKCLEELVSKSLVIAHQVSFSSRIKTCGLHSAFWHLCNREAGKNKFSHVVNSYADGLAEGIKIQRRLCVHNNVLFGIKDVYNSMASVSNARSLLCSGPHHRYPVPIICCDLRLLRVLDAFTIRFYEFPMEVLKLVQLRYLAFTYDGNNIPSSISKLWKLQFLIVRRRLSIRSRTTALSYLPVEIWNMEELNHIHITGSDLRDPCGALLPNLSTLLDVNARSCTKDVLVRMPNLSKLGVRIELSPSDHHSELRLFSCFDHISHLHNLKSLKCVVVNPTFISNDVAAAAAASFPRLNIFPPSLVKLTLSGFGFAWEHMGVIGNLCNLEVLKLQFYAFRGPKWENYDDGFFRLDVLEIEDSNLVHWRVGQGCNCFSQLKCLIIKHCYRLEVIPMEFGKSLEKIEVVECNSLAVTCAEKIKEDQRRNGRLLEVNVHSSKDGGNYM